MKTWGIIATILFLGFAAGCGWLYFENDNLKREINTREEAKEDCQTKIEGAANEVSNLSLFVQAYFGETSDSLKMTEIDNKITELDNRNVQVAYENYKNASSKDKQAALGNFLSEYLEMLSETLGNEVDISRESTSQSQSSSAQSNKEEPQEIEGEGEYSENVFPE